MRGIVVDENVIIEATVGKKPDGSPAWVEAEFMFRLFRSGNVVFVNTAIIDKFRAIRSKLDIDSHPHDYNHKIYKSLMLILMDGKKTTRVDGIKIEREGLKKCDKEFVGVALQSGSIIVTSDMPLCDIINDMRASGYPIECATAEQALDLLNPTDKGKIDS